MNKLISTKTNVKKNYGFNLKKQQNLPFVFVSLKNSYFFKEFFCNE